MPGMKKPEVIPMLSAEEKNMLDLLAKIVATSIIKQSENEN